MIMKATLTNVLTKKKIRVHDTTDHPDCSYGKAVWVDDDNNAYIQVGLEKFNPLYEIKLDEPWNTRMRIGEKITALRKAQGLTVRQLAELTGINPANISNIENGKVSTGIDVLQKIASALNTEINF